MLDRELVRTINRWQRLVWEEIYLGRAGSARQRLLAAYEEQAAYLGSRDAKRALMIYLQLLECDCDCAFAADDNERAALLWDARQAVEAEEKTVLAATCRARVLLILGTQLHLLGEREMTSNEVDRLLRQVPEQSLGHQTCSNLALWAFATRSLGHLQYAQRLFESDAYDFMVAFTRQRVKVMVNLVSGECTSGELAELLQLLPHLLHLDWYERWIVPEATLQSLWTPQLERQLAQRRQHMRNSVPVLPQSSCQG